MRHHKMVLTSNKGKTYKTFIIHSISQKALLVYLDGRNDLSYTATYVTA